MSKIIVKGFRHGYEEECLPPSLSVEFLGEKRYVLNFRDYYFCECENTLAGRKGQVKVDKQAYNDFDKTLREVLSIYGDTANSEIVDEENVISSFLDETLQYYYTTL